MQYLFVVICFVGLVAAMLFVKSLSLGAGLTAIIVIPLVLIAIYSLARISPNESGTENKVPRQ